MTHREDLLKADLFSEILLLGSGIALFLPILLIIVAMIERTPVLH